MSVFLNTLSCVDPMTGATWVAAGTERLEVVPGLVKSDDEEEGPPRGGSSMTHTYKRENRKQRNTRHKTKDAPA